MSSSVNLLITGFAGPNAIVALDDINFNYGHCPPQDFCDLSVSSCGWDYDITLPVPWRIGSGLNGNGPKTDHTSGGNYGNYFYIDTKSSLLKAGNKGALLSPIYSPNKKCLQFW